MTEAGRRLRRGPGRGPGAWATPSPTRPPTSRASTPGPRPPSSPRSPSARGSWPATCTTRASPTITAADIELRRAGSATSSSCSPSPRSSCERATGRTPSSAVRVHPAMLPLDPSAGVGARQLQRGVRRGRSRRRADVLRTRRRRRPDRQRGARRPDRRRPQPAQGRRARSVGAARRGADPARSTTCVSAYYLNLEVRRPARRARARWPACSATTACRSARWSRKASATRPDLVFITHRALERDVQATLRDLRELDVVHHVGSVIRVLDDEPDLTP